MGFLLAAIDLTGPAAIWGAAATIISGILGYLTVREKLNSAREKRESDERVRQQSQTMIQLAKLIDSREAATNEIYEQWRILSSLAREEKNKVQALY